MTISASSSNASTVSNAYQSRSLIFISVQLPTSHPPSSRPPAQLQPFLYLTLQIILPVGTFNATPIKSTFPTLQAHLALRSSNARVCPSLIHLLFFSLLLARSFASRGRPVSRRQPNIHLPSGLTHRLLSPLGLDIPRRPMSAGPYTEPILTENPFDWSAPQDSALLSLSSLENRRKRSASCRSLRGTDISGMCYSNSVNHPVS